MPGPGYPGGHSLPRSNSTVGDTLAGNVSRHKDHVCFAKKRVSYRVRFKRFCHFYAVKGPCQLPCYYGSIGAGDRLSIQGAVRRNEGMGGFWGGAATEKLPGYSDAEN